MFRWGHFSDIHLLYRNYETDMLRSDLLKTLRAQEPLDAILITGDLFHRGVTSTEAVDEVTEFIREMAESARCDICRVYICAGNHDLTRSKERKKAIDAEIAGRRGMTPKGKTTPQVFEPYCTDFNRINSHITGEFLDPKEIHRVVTLPEANLIILNTAVFAGQTYPGQKHPKPKPELEDTNLYICDKHLAKVRKAAESANEAQPGKLNLVLAHHGAECFAPMEQENLSRTLNHMDADFYLCGHIHKNRSLTIPDTATRQIACGGPFKDGYNRPGFVIGCFDPTSAKVDLCAYTYEDHWDIGLQLPRPWNRGEQHITLDRLQSRQAAPSVEPQPAPELPSDRFPQFSEGSYVLSELQEDHRLPAGPCLFREHYGRLSTRTERLPVAYKELFGSAEKGKKEYHEGGKDANLICDFLMSGPSDEDFAACASREFFRTEYKKQYARAEALGYVEHPPKLWLYEAKEERGGSTVRLTLRLGRVGYLEHRCYREAMRFNSREQAGFCEIIRQPKGNNSLLRNATWAMCGGGVWIVTSDGYLAVSRRTYNVAEEAGKFGYSSSGSFDRYSDDGKNQTPGLAMCQELREELGLRNIRPEALTLINLGIDLDRYLIQFSYYLQIPETAEELMERKADYATTADEQMTFFVPLQKPDICYSLLEHCDFEPGAAYSLMRLLQKRFGSLMPKGKTIHRPRLICADLHGDTQALREYAGMIREGSRPAGTLILAGDVYGGRGPMAVELVRVMFDVKYGRLPMQALREALKAHEIPMSELLGENLEKMVFQTLHSGVFLAVLAHMVPGFRERMAEDLRVAYRTMDSVIEELLALGCEVWMIPGNGEQATCVDFVYDDDWMTEHVVSEEASFFFGYQKPAGMHVVKDAASVDGILLAGVDFRAETVKKLCLEHAHCLAVTHYLPTFCENNEDFAAELARTLPFPNPLKTSKVDLQRSREAAKLYSCVERVAGGHYHTGDAIHDAGCPETVCFGEPHRRRLWIRPGALVDANSFT